MNNLISEILGTGKTPGFHIGLYFGSFNPVHVGHMAIANYMVEYTDINQLWFVVSPHNPQKEKSNLLNDYHRLELVRQAIGDDIRFRASNIEFNLPKPSFTIDTLTHLSEQYPQHRFSLIMGSDNLETFHKWKNYESILENYGIIVYPRPGFDPEKVKLYTNVSIAEAPLIEISSTFLRESIQAGKDIRHFLPLKTWEYLDEMNFYRK